MMTEEPTRVLHVLGQFERSGAEMMLLQSADEWQKHRYELDLLATGPEAGPMMEPLRGIGYRMHHIPFRSKLRYLPSLDFAPRFLALCRSRRYDVLHLHTEAAMLLFVLLGRFAGVPTIVRTVHNTFTFRGVLGYRKRWERRIARSAGVHFAFVSESVQQVEEEHSCNSGIYTPNWFDTRHFRPPSTEERADARRMLDCAEDTIVIVSVGNCNKAKNHSALLQALAPLTAKRRILYLHVGREAADRAERQLVESLGIESSVRFAGSHADPRPFLWAADLFVMPSLREGLGNAALEAVGAGTPALFTNARGLRDIANKGRWIKQVAPENLSLGIVDCLETPSAHARMRALDDSATIHREYSINDGVAYWVRALYKNTHASIAIATTEKGARTV